MSKPNHKFAKHKKAPAKEYEGHDGTGRILFGSLQESLPEHRIEVTYGFPRIRIAIGRRRVVAHGGIVAVGSRIVR